MGAIEAWVAEVPGRLHLGRTTIGPDEARELAARLLAWADTGSLKLESECGSK